MSEGVPKSRVTLTYDTKQPEGREKPRELPFRLMVLGDVGGEKVIFKKGVEPDKLEQIPIDERKVRQLNGRNLGDVIKGFKIKLRDVPLDAEGDAKIDVLIDSMASFTPNEVLRLITGQKSRDRVHPMLAESWQAELDSSAPQGVAAQLWKGDPHLAFRWERREGLVGFQKSYQNSKKLRDALKALSVAVDKEDDVQADALKDEIAKTKSAWSSTLGTLKSNVEAELNKRNITLPVARKDSATSETEATTEETP